MNDTNRKEDPAFYDHKATEAAWRETWAEQKLDTPNIEAAKNPFYNLMMFPYPSAEGLHVGNMYAFTGSDIYGRFKRMEGHDVFEPIGLDGFGIHSENYALKIGRHPMEHASVTEKNFYDQLHRIGAMFDWTRTVETYEPGYYKWTQWLFVQMFKHNLAYRAKSQVNWCPSCKTVLADEQVIPARNVSPARQSPDGSSRMADGQSVAGGEGRCERCGNAVIKKLLEQWFFEITAYAEKLLDNTRTLNWSEKVLIAQRNWIGKSEGVLVEFALENENEKIEVFTTAHDTIYGATFMVIAPEHPLLKEISIPKKQIAEVSNYIDKSQKKSDEERIGDKTKTGVFTGLYVINPFTKKPIELWVADYVLLSYGTGAVMGVPGHDSRDHEFAIKYKLPIKQVARPTAKTERAPHIEPDGFWDYSEIKGHFGNQSELFDSEILNGLTSIEAKSKIEFEVESRGIGKKISQYHLRDWLISRQRYWGPPIPLIFCEHCAKASQGERKDMPGWWTVPEKDLPIKLPKIDDYQPKGTGVAPLATHKEFYETPCPHCGKAAKRETDVSDTFLDSSWYFLRYPSVGAKGSDKVPFDKEITKKWLPVDMYTGGAEHSVLHLMYSRFVTMALHDWGYIDFDEPFPNFYAHGLIIKDGAKMSKSKGNIVNPDQYIDLYGADALRIYLMFTGPYDMGGDFRDSAMEGMAKWVRRAWRMALNAIDKQSTDSSAAVETALQMAIKKVGEDIERRRYNTAISALMIFTNVVADEGGKLGLGDLKKFLAILAPFAPFITEELFKRSGGEGSIHKESWPKFDGSRLVVSTIQVIVQVNGKMRGTLSMEKLEAGDQASVEVNAKEDQNISKHLRSGEIKKVIFVPGKLINFVVS